MSTATISALQMHQMIFIYNAVIAGWSVKRAPETGNFRFKKRLRNHSERNVYQQDGFLQRFVQNMQKLEVAEEFRKTTKTDNGVTLTSQTEEIESFELSVDQDVPIG